MFVASCVCMCAGGHTYNDCARAETSGRRWRRWFWGRSAAGQGQSQTPGSPSGLWNNVTRVRYTRTHTSVLTISSLALAPVHTWLHLVFTRDGTTIPSSCTTTETVFTAPRRQGTVISWQFRVSQSVPAVQLFSSELKATWLNSESPVILASVVLLNQVLFSCWSYLLKPVARQTFLSPSSSR